MFGLLAGRCSAYRGGYWHCMTQDRQGNRRLEAAFLTEMKFNDQVVGVMFCFRHTLQTPKCWAGNSCGPIELLLECKLVSVAGGWEGKKTLPELYMTLLSNFGKCLHQLEHLKLPTLPGNRWPGAQVKVFPITSHLRHFTWHYWGLNLGPFVWKAGALPLSYGRCPCKKQPSA